MILPYIYIYIYEGRLKVFCPSQKKHIAEHISCGRTFSHLMKHENLILNSLFVYVSMWPMKRWKV